MKFLIQRFLLFSLLIQVLLPTSSFGQKLNAADSALKATQEQLKSSELRRIRDSLKLALLTKDSEEQELVYVEKNAKDDSIWKSKQLAKIERQKINFKGIPVLLFKDTLFMVYTSLGQYSPEERAKDIEYRIQKLYEDPRFNKDSLTSQDFLNLINLSYKSTPITSVSELDALWENTSQDSLARAITNIIGQKVTEYQNKNSFKNKIVQAAVVFLIIAVAATIVWLVNLIFNRIVLRIQASDRKFLRGIRIRNYQLLKKEQFFNILIRVLKVLKLLFILILWNAMVPIVFSIFPQTRQWSKTILDWLWQPLTRIKDSVIAYLPDLITIIVIALVMRFVLRSLRFFALEIERDALKIKGFHPEWAKPTFSIVRFVLMAFTLILIFPHLPGSDSIAFKGVSVFLGVLISVGSSSAISNIIAGLVITYMRPFKVGDWIKTGEIVGIVKEKNTLVTRLRTIDNEDITVPNSSILNSHTVNYSTACDHEGLIISKEVTVNYDVPMDLAEKLLLQAAQMTRDISVKPEAFVFQKNLDLMYATFQLKAYTHQPERMYHIHSDLYKNIMKVFLENDIDLICSQFVTIKADDPHFGSGRHKVKL